MRTTFIKTLMAEAENNKNIMLLTGDLGYSVLEPFQNKFPKQFLNVGIAEQNMAGIAAGLALEGKTVFIYSIGNFPTLRCLEQIRYDICYHNLDVKIVAVGAGYAYGPLGVSHHTTEDIGVFRTIPNIEIGSPADPYEVESITKYFCASKKPSYLRLNKNGEEILHKTKPVIATGNEFFQIKEGENVAILATGAITATAKSFISDRSLNWSLYSFPMIFNPGNSSLLSLFNKYDKFITLEEHQLNCGFGSLIVESASDLYMANSIDKYPKIFRAGIENKYISFSGSQEYLRKDINLKLNEFFEKSKYENQGN